MKEITLGSDPEFFLSQYGSGKIVSAIPYVEENKYSPRTQDGVNFYHDNVAVECTIPPAFSQDDFLNNFNNIFRTLRGISANVQPVILASAFFEEVELEHPDAREFGCNPEFCVYSQKLEAPPKDVRFDFRSAGGHIHIGIKDFQTADYGDFLIAPPSKWMLVRALDVFLSIPLTVVDNDPSSVSRKELYGKAGRCRATDYGVEYRTPSNIWTNTPQITAWTYDRVIKTCKDLEKDLSILNNFSFKEVREIIDTGDKTKALDFCKKHGIEVPDWFSYNIIPQW